MKKREQGQDAGVNVRVILRCRPPTGSEIGNMQVVECVPTNREVKITKGAGNVMKTFTFDGVCTAATTQELIFKRYGAPVIDEVLQGFNCTIFAYGQTGTGKTFTMEGDMVASQEGLPAIDAGIVPRSIHYIFDKLKRANCEYSIRISYLEIYNEELSDLLNAEDGKSLRIFEDGSRRTGEKSSNVSVDKLEEIPVSNPKDAIDLMQQALRRRRTAETQMNARSSRSHCIFTTTICMKESTPDGEDIIKIGKLNLVDLAGSENVQRSGAVGGRAKEAGMINQSLLTLGRVINALVDHNSYVPYRDSKLTRLLQDSLGGRTKTCIIATVSPSIFNLDETLSTLDYAHRAKSIKNQPELNQKVGQRVVIGQWAGEIERLQQELHWARQKEGVHLSFEKFTAMENELKGFQDKISYLEQENAEKEELFKSKVEDYEKSDAFNRRRAEKTIDDVNTQMKIIDEKQREICACNDYIVTGVTRAVDVAGEAVQQFAGKVTEGSKKVESTLNETLKLVSNEALVTKKTIITQTSSAKNAVEKLKQDHSKLIEETRESSSLVRDEIVEKMNAASTSLEMMVTSTVDRVENAKTEITAMQTELSEVISQEHGVLMQIINTEVKSRIQSVENSVNMLAVTQQNSYKMMTETFNKMLMDVQRNFENSLSVIKSDVESLQRDIGDVVFRAETSFKETSARQIAIQKSSMAHCDSINEPVESIHPQVVSTLNELADLMTGANESNSQRVIRFADLSNNRLAKLSNSLNDVDEAATNTSQVFDVMSAQINNCVTSSLRDVIKQADDVSRSQWIDARNVVLQVVSSSTQAVNNRIHELSHLGKGVCAMTHESALDIIRNCVSMGSNPPPLAMSFNPNLSFQHPIVHPPMHLATIPPLTAFNSSNTVQQNINHSNSSTVLFGAGNASHSLPNSASVHSENNPPPSTAPLSNGINKIPSTCRIPSIPTPAQTPRARANVLQNGGLVAANKPVGQTRLRSVTPPPRQMQY